MSKNNKPKTNKNTTGAANPFQPIITINTPVTVSRRQLLLFLEAVGIELPILLIEEINQINLQITINSGGQTDA